jgi:hypothetical protein
MKSWDHLDVVITVGVCATILGAGIFYFAFGGAPYGLLAQQSVETVIDPQEVTQTSLGEAIVAAQRIRNMEDTQFGHHQERLGVAIVGATHAQQARSALVPAFRAAARESLLRLQGMIQETAGRALVNAAQRMWREGNTEAAQLAFIESLGRIRAGMILREREALPLREEALGWTVVGGALAMDRYLEQGQELLGSAVVNAGVTTARLETERPLAQESLGSAVFVAQSATSSGVSPLLMASAGTGPTGQGTREIPYQSGVILFAALFVIFWGVRSIADSGTTLPAYGTPAPEADQYRKVG